MIISTVSDLFDFDMIVISNRNGMYSRGCNDRDLSRSPIECLAPAFNQTTKDLSPDQLCNKTTCNVASVHQTASLQCDTHALAANQRHTQVCVGVRGTTVDIVEMDCAGYATHKGQLAFRVELCAAAPPPPTFC